MEMFINEKLVTIKKVILKLFYPSEHVNKTFSILLFSYFSITFVHFVKITKIRKLKTR